MRKNKILLLLSVVLVAGWAAVGCNRDDDEDSTPYLDGTMNFSIPYYARVGETVTIEPYGVIHPDGGDIKVYVSAADPVKAVLPDTVYVHKGKIEQGDLQFSFVMPDSLASFTISCYASATGYYSRSGSADITVISNQVNGSLTGAGIHPDDEAYVDHRVPGATHEQTYYVAEIGNLRWFRNNLAYLGSGIPYLLCEPVSYTFGCYYTYEEALTACPEGWRLPTESEWIDLGKSLTGKTVGYGETLEGAAGAIMGDIYFNGEKMWEFWPAVKITNSTTLGVLPAGYSDVSGKYPVFLGINKYAAFWTSTPAEDGMAYYRYINVNTPDIYGGTADTRSLALSVRCVQEVI